MKKIEHRRLGAEMVTEANFDTSPASGSEGT